MPGSYAAPHPSGRALAVNAAAAAGVVCVGPSRYHCAPARPALLRDRGLEPFPHA